MTRRLTLVALALSLGTLGAGSVPAGTEGRIIDVHGHPVRGATASFVVDPHGIMSRAFFVQILAFGHAKVPKAIEAKIGKDGRFHADLPDGQLLVVVRRRGRTLGAAYLEAQRGPKVRIVLRRGPVIGGRVTRGDGTPAAGVAVAVGSTFFRLPPVRTGRDGRFRTRVPIASLFYLAYLSGKGIARARRGLKAGTRNHLVVAPGRTVTGTVRYQGAPVAGATVTAKTRLVVTATTDAKGRFALTGLRLHPVFHGAKIVARKGDEVGATTLPAGANPKPLVLDLEPPGSLEVYVLDLERRPIAGATVSANGETATTDKDGHAAIPSTPLGKVRLQVVAAGHAESKTTVKVAGKGTIATVPLEPGGALVVRIDGLTPRGRKTGVVAVDRYVSDPKEAYRRVVELRGKAVARIPYLPDGAYVVWASAAGQAPPPVQRATVPRKKPVVFEIPKTLSIAGRVVDGHGHSIARVFVRAKRVYPWARAKPVPAQAAFSALTNHLGRFRIGPVGPGTYTLTAGGGNPYPKSKPVTAKAGDQKVVVLLHRPRHLSGVVVGLDGRPMANATVEVTCLEDGRPVQDAFATSMGHTDAHGHFDVGGLRLGQVRVEVTAGKLDQFSSREVVVPAGAQELTVVVGPRQ